MYLSVLYSMLYILYCAKSLLTVTGEKLNKAYFAVCVGAVLVLPLEGDTSSNPGLSPFNRSDEFY